ncbi:hypothetical protein NHH03_01565 [Stieleria sp. TO1_6]|uniref:type VI secretion protein IcmF/TssM N-terminal domain-containing protein n=1 Tax=Stieleria tagensis TaxID=2956795 RepID=UPI00209A99A8|nr:type VI secretion protein IcmF/TssM N-terminal domain-containing protein [Stieleria tagensis]MCO8120407.1 hypothetical protein [Stieleria tagensis]
MSNETPPTKKRRFFRRLLPSSVAGSAALWTALALVLILAAVWTLRLFGSQSVRLSHAMTIPRMIIEFALVVIIPIVLYWGIRRWNQVIQGEFPDIDRAWQAGIDALHAQGIEATDYPIFLILGSSGHQVELGLMEALDTRMNLHGIPDASGISHALQWYMSSDAIYLFCPGASSLSALMGRWTTPSMTSNARRVPPGGLTQTTNQAAPQPSSGPAATAPAAPVGLPKIQRAAPAPTSTAGAASNPAAAPASAALTRESNMKAAPANPPAATAEPAAADAYMGTIQFQSVDSSPKQATASATPFSMPAATPQAPAAHVPTPPQAPASPFSRDAMRPAPRFDGTISFDQFQPQQPDAAGFAAAVTPSAATSAQSTAAHAAGNPSSIPDQIVRSVSNQASEAARSARFDPTVAAQSGSAENSIATTGTATNSIKPVAPVAMPRVAAGKVALPASLDTSDQLPRLRYVCQLLKRVRRPMCGINGAVTLIPFELSRVGPLQLSAFAQSARGDVSTIQETLGIRAPVTAVLVGLEQDKGFGELVRRLQPGLLSRRLGGRFDLRSRPTPNELNTHSDRLCDAFEDWVYRLFSREDGLAQQRGNRKLYALTSKIRHELKPRLRIVLGQAFGCESSDQSTDPENDESFFFSGCYFAASGATTGQPAFVKGVLKDKLVDEQSQVQWTQAAMRTHRSFRLFAIAGWILTVLLALLLLVKWL